MYYVYVLKSDSHGTRYVGLTQNVRERLWVHNNGESRYTSGRRPWLLLYSEEPQTRQEARIREKFLKSGSGREWLDMQGYK